MDHGFELRTAVAERQTISFIGIYDVFSATLAARYYDALFVSGFGMAASHYGLPDIGFIAWPDMLDFVERLRTVLPDHHLLVDIDDGYCDTEVACHMVSRLERAGASGVVLEDQKRPRKCGHYAGKELLELKAYLNKLERVLSTRRDLFVVARTDASEPDEIIRRVEAFASAGADAILVDGLSDPALIGELRTRVEQPLVFNQIAGGKSPSLSVSELTELGARMIIYSTPCLFAAQAAIEATMCEMKENDGRLPRRQAQLAACSQVLTENLARRDQPARAVFCERISHAA